MSDINQLFQPCTVPTFIEPKEDDPSTWPAKSTEIPAGFVRWYQVAPGTPDAEVRPTPQEILADPAKWIGSLHAHLQMGMEVEVFTLPPYLAAYLSIPDESDNDYAAFVVRSVLMEEMLHMTLAANVLNASGGRPQLDAPRVISEYPSRIPYSGLSTVVGLTPFSQATMCGLRTVETPSEYAPQNPSWDDALGFTSIGEFYDVALDMLWTLTLVLGPDQVFTGDDGNQFLPGSYYGGGGEIIVVPAWKEGQPTDLGDFVPLPDATAEQQHRVFRACPSLRRAFLALNEIVHQGEGGKTFVDPGALPKHAAVEAMPDDTSSLTTPVRMDGGSRSGISDGDELFGETFEPAHFYRFDEVIKGRRYRQGDQPFEPTGDLLKVDYAAAYPMKPNPKEEDYADHPEIFARMRRFNVTFTRLLLILQEVYTGHPDRFNEAVAVMYELKYLGQELMQTPVPGDAEGRTVGTPFQFRLPGQ